MNQGVRMPVRPGRALTWVSRDKVLAEGAVAQLAAWTLAKGQTDAGQGGGPPMMAGWAALVGTRRSSS